MTIRDYIQVLREQIAWIIVAAIAGLAVGAAYYLVTPREYTANTSLYVVSQGENSTSAAYQGAQLSEQRVISYVELATSDRITQEVINRLGLRETPEELRDHITATASLNSVLITISATENSPDAAAAVANTFGSALTEVVNEIERPIVSGEPQLITIRTVQPAAVPGDSSSTGLVTILGLGLVAGLVVGVALAFVRYYLDASIKSPERLREVSGAPILGVIPFSQKIAETPLFSHQAAQSPQAEAIRALRTNLQFIDVDQPRKVLVVTSSVASEGKTVTAVNLALACSSAGLSVLLVEADLRKPRASNLLGLDNSVGLTSVLASRTKLERSIQHWDSGLDVLASGPIPPNPSELLASKHMADIQKHLAYKYDLVLIDTPPIVPVSDAAAIASTADGVLLICRFASTSSADLTTATNSLSVLSIPVVGSVLTMAREGAVNPYSNTNYDERPQR